MSKQRSGFEHLKEDYPIFEIANKLNVSKTLDLIGDDVTVPPKATIKVESSKLMQLPNSTIFKVVNPGVSTLAKYGLLKTSEQKQSASTSSPEEDQPTASGSGGKKK